MNLLSGAASRELFGGPVPETVRRLLDEAAGAPPERMRALLWTAQVSAPDCLPVYYLLYKFHASRRELDLAERAARGGLQAAAHKAGLPQDWQQVDAPETDFAAPGPARFWLFTLKALAFIRLRSGEPAEARALLAHARKLDPHDSVGVGVIEALARAAR